MINRRAKHARIACGVREGRRSTVMQELGSHESSINPGCVLGKSSTFSMGERCNIKRAPHACVENWKSSP